MSTLNNKVQLIGNLGAAPEVKTTESGKTMATLSIATTDRYKDSNGEKQENTQWHRVVAWGKTAEIAEKYLKKGSRIAIEGRLNNRSYDDTNGEKKYITEVVATELLMLDPKAE